MQFVKCHLTFSKLKESGEANPETTEVAEILTLTDEVRRLTSIKLEAKLKSTALLLGTTGEMRIGASLANNTVELHSLKMGEGNGGTRLKYIFFIMRNTYSSYLSWSRMSQFLLVSIVILLVHQSAFLLKSLRG